MEIDNKCVNELRVLSNEMITHAKSGHPGIALGSAPIIYSLYANILAIDAKMPSSVFRDRFVLSAGHGSSILYATLYAMGYGLNKQDLMDFRNINSKTPGHPEVNITQGIDASTGPLGQGVANAVGMAIAEKHFEALFNKQYCKLFDSKIFCLVGDGCLMEGVCYEALSLAGNLQLDNLILIYDCNKITIEGKTDITFTDDIELRFKSIGFDVLSVKNGNDVEEITDVLLKAKHCKKPSIVVVPTTIGFGSQLAGSEKVHGSPLTEEMLNHLKQKLNVNKPEFDLSCDVKEHFNKKQNQASLRLQKQNNIDAYKIKYPKEYEKFKELFEKKDFADVIKKLKSFTSNGNTTRDINHDIQNQFASIMPQFFGGSADVATSTKAYVKTNNCFSKDDYSSKYMHYGVREHAMAGISNGLALFGGMLPYQSCFFSFYDYLKPALRMSALQNLKVLSVFSHDCITAGQDGPTHQPIEQLPSLRLMPNSIVSRPYNAQEIIATYVWLLQNQKPTCMIVSKDKQEFLSSDVQLALNGGYVLVENNNAKLTLVATGSDVDRCLQVAELLQKNDIACRIVSMPCISVFEEQTNEYKKSVFKDLPIAFIEASADTVWYKFAKPQDLVININNFGKSGSPTQVLEYMQFDAKSLYNKILNWFKK